MENNSGKIKQLTSFFLIQNLYVHSSKITLGTKQMYITFTKNIKSLLARI